MTTRNQLVTRHLTYKRMIVLDEDKYEEQIEKSMEFAFDLINVALQHASSEEFQKRGETLDLNNVCIGFVFRRTLKETAITQNLDLHIAVDYGFTICFSPELITTGTQPTYRYEGKELQNSKFGASIYLDGWLDDPSNRVKDHFEYSWDKAEEFHVVKLAELFEVIREGITISEYKQKYDSYKNKTNEKTHELIQEAGTYLESLVKKE